MTAKSITELIAPSAEIVVRGACEHNLKNIDVRIPRNSLTVITGPSGSGKSSPLVDVLEYLPAKLQISMTTNGLHFTNERIAYLARCGMGKMHVSIHFPERQAEVRRAIRPALKANSNDSLDLHQPNL